MIRDQFFRMRYRLCGRQEVSPHLIHVVLDDTSQRALALPTWDRTVFGRIVGILQDTNAKLIACDILFKDPGFPDDDELLRAASGPRPVLFPMVVFPGGGTDSQYPEPGDGELRQVVARNTLEPGFVRGSDPPADSWVVTPFPKLSRAAQGLGHINSSPDRDGICRRVNLLIPYGDGYLPALALRVVLDYFEVSEDNIEVWFGRRIILHNARIRDDYSRDIVVPIDRHGGIIVNFVGPWEASFLSFPVHKLLTAAADEQARAQLYDLVDRAVVVISDVSTTTRDYGAGIFEAVYPLSGLHVNIVNSFLTGALLHDQRFFVSTLIALLFAALLWLGAAAFEGVRFSLAGVMLYALFYGFHFWVFIAGSSVPAIAAPTVGFAVAIVSVNLYRLILAQRDRGALLARLVASEKLEAVNRELLGQKQKLEIANQKLRELLPPAGSRHSLTATGGRIDSMPAEGGSSERAPPPGRPAGRAKSPERLELRSPPAFADILTGSQVMLSVFRRIESFAASSSPVLITGESGVGKELVARAVHRLSGRKGKFVAENVAGLDDTMFTDTLFGHARGAFTDASSARKGLVEEAAGGTLFLDEIGDLSVGSQVKLLRFVEEKEYRPLGSDQLRRSDARIIIATNAELKKKVEEGKFREDLFYRLTHQIDIPPLRERSEDLPLLLDHFVGQTCRTLGTRKPEIPGELVDLLGTYRFPGNVRELKNMIENALGRSASGRNTSRVVPLSYFAEYVRAGTERNVPDLDTLGSDGRLIPSSGRFPSLKEIEKTLVTEALRRTGGNQNLAARLLGLSPSALSRRINKGGTRQSP